VRPAAFGPETECLGFLRSVQRQKRAEGGVHGIAINKKGRFQIGSGLFARLL
jgi:hypothetical protein